MEEAKKKDKRDTVFSGYARQCRKVGQQRCEMLEGCVSSVQGLVSDKIMTAADKSLLQGKLSLGLSYMF